MYQSSCIQVTRTVKGLLKWPQLLHTSNSLLGGRGWTAFINDLERYPHCDWLKTSYSANKVTFCKYAPGDRCFPFPLATSLLSRQNNEFASSYAYSQVYQSRTKLQKLSY